MTLHELIAAGSRRIGHPMFSLEELYGEVLRNQIDCRIRMHQRVSGGPEHVFCVDPDYDAFDDWFDADEQQGDPH